jgi:hypothetical protein
MSTLFEPKLYALKKQDTAPHETPEARAEYRTQAHDARWPEVSSARQMRDRATVFITLVEIVEHEAAIEGLTGISLPASAGYRRLGAEDRARRAAEAAAR